MNSDVVNHSASSPNGSDRRVIELVRDWLPHRYPFLLVDRVIDYEPQKFIHAIKMVSGLDPYLQGHFPTHPVMPGVLIVEALAQASGILGRLTFPERDKSCLLTEIGDTRFRRQVVPGDRLDLNVTFEKQRKDFFWFTGVAKVDGEIAASAVLTAKLT
ncbi:MAG: 3-hydroxyacyl-ACP dehydratase FabZ [Oligoflexus sp.]|jgi:3-hydroxyacyl-[acyl-carrier-protein] dehydratase